MQRRAVPLVRATLAITLLLGTGVVIARSLVQGRSDDETRGSASTSSSETTFSHAIARLDAAIVREDRSSLLREWRAAYAVGVAASSWQPMIALGDAAQRIAMLDHQREPFEREARAAYLQALRAARRAHSSDGLMAVAAGFESLGNPEMAHQLRRLAERLHVDGAQP